MGFYETIHWPMRKSQFAKVKEKRAAIGAGSEVFGNFYRMPTPMISRPMAAAVNQVSTLAVFETVADR